VEEPILHRCYTVLKDIIVLASLAWLAMNDAQMTRKFVRALRVVPVLILVADIIHPSLTYCTGPNMHVRWNRGTTGNHSKPRLYAAHGFRFADVEINDAEICKRTPSFTRTDTAFYFRYRLPLPGFRPDAECRIVCIRQVTRKQ
jgi:hypothetical protein